MDDRSTAVQPPQRRNGVNAVRWPHGGRRLQLCLVLAALVSALDVDAQLSPPAARVVEELRIDGGARDFSIITNLFVAPNGTIVVNESPDRRFRFFDASGRQVATAGRRGQGPGEFESLSIVYAGFKGDTFWVYPHRSRRISYFTSSGRFVRSQVLPVAPPRPSRADGADPLDWPTAFSQPYAISQDGAMLLAAVVPTRAVGGRMVADGDRALVVRASDGSIVARFDGVTTAPLAVSSRLQPGAGITVPYAALGHFAAAHDGSVLAIVTVHPENTSSARVRVAAMRLTGDTIFAREFRVAGERIAEGARDAALAERGTSFAPPVASELRALARGLMPPIYPPVVRLLVGLDKSVWLQLRSPGAGQRWVALNSSGEPTLSVDLPQPDVFRLEQASLSRIYGTDRRASGIKDIVRLRIQR